MSNTPAIMAENILLNACEQHATDIHFYPEENKVIVFFRKFGFRQKMKELPKDEYKMILSYFKFSSYMDIGEKRRPQSGTFLFEDKHSQKYSLRLSTLPHHYFESLSIRILPQENSPNFDQLFLFPKQFKQMKSWMRLHSGIIIMTGPTGSGKTTTMYSLLQSMLKERSFQAITIEDPIERKIDHVLQVEINEKAGITYQNGLKAALRHDPDVILIGEIRDVETATFAFRAALTGHLVLTTLHAKNAEGTIDRLIELGVNRTDIKETLVAVASLKLLPIIKAGEVYRQAAIVELLDDSSLRKKVDGGEKVIDRKKTFKYLIQKAYLYGYISEENLIL